GVPGVGVGRAGGCAHPADRAVAVDSQRRARSLGGSAREHRQRRMGTSILPRGIPGLVSALARRSAVLLARSASHGAHHGAQAPPRLVTVPVTSDITSGGWPWIECQLLV